MSNCRLNNIYRLIKYWKNFNDSFEYAWRETHNDFFTMDAEQTSR